MHLDSAVRDPSPQTADDSSGSVLASPQGSYLQLCARAFAHHGYEVMIGFDEKHCHIKNESFQSVKSVFDNDFTSA